jgi:hypothetical protein
LAKPERSLAKAWNVRPALIDSSQSNLVVKGTSIAFIDEPEQLKWLPLMRHPWPTMSRRRKLIRGVRRTHVINHMSDHLSDTCLRENVIVIKNVVITKELVEQVSMKMIKDQILVGELL